jgi:ATP-dependent Clp protease ATP-binding subunit ClpC
MFERYTEKARRIIFFARYEASEFGSAYIEPEHLFLGLFREAPGVLEGLGVPVNLDRELRQEMKPSGEKFSTSVDLPLSNSGKRVLAYGAEESENLQHKYIAPEHFLLALLREDTPAQSILLKAGITIEPLRESIAKQGAKVGNLREEIDLPNPNETIVHALRKTFKPMAARLTSDVEPAVTFLPKPGDAA